MEFEKFNFVKKFKFKFNLNFIYLTSITHGINKEPLGDLDKAKVYRNL